MLANRWLAFLGFLLSVNTLSVWGVSTPSTSRFSFLSSPLRPSAVRVLPKYGRFLSQLSSASSAASHSGVSTPTDKKGEEANPSTDALFMQLKKWLVLNGAELDVEGIELRSQSNSAYVPVKNQPPEKYLTAMRPYSRGEVIATIPPHLHFTADVLEDLLAPFTTTSNSSSSNRRMQDSTQDGITAAAAAGGGEEGKFVWVTNDEEEALLFKSLPSPIKEIRKDTRIRLSFLLTAYKELFSLPYIKKDPLLINPSSSSPPSSPPPSSSSPSSSSLLDGWLYYINIIPFPPFSCPLFWSSEELNALNHPIINAVFSRLQSLRNSFSLNKHFFYRFTYIQKKEGPLGGPLGGPLEGPIEGPLGEPHEYLEKENELFKKLVQAHATVCSRCIQLNKENFAFVPLIDFCAHATHSPNARLQYKANNSSNSSNCSSNNNNNSNSSNKEEVIHACKYAGVSVQLVATRDIKKGESIFISFNKEIDNPTLLFNYGLLPTNNPYERISVEFSARLVYLSLRSIDAQVIMLTEDFNFLGKNIINKLINLQLLPTRCTDTSIYSNYNPHVFITNEQGPDQRLLAAAKTRAKRFLISFLQQILFEQFNTINEEEDINMLRSQHMIIPSKKHKGLEERIPLSPAMDIAIRFRQKRRNVLIKAINKIKESLNSKKEEKKP